MAGKVLLIEDEENIAEAIRFILSRDGWEVTHMADGRGAVEAAQAMRPGLVILDHMLPGKAGWTSWPRCGPTRQPRRCGC